MKSKLFYLLLILVSSLLIISPIGIVFGEETEQESISKCATVLCKQVICDNATQYEYTPVGGCCKECALRCELVDCAMPKCPLGVKPIKKNPTDCCLSCPSVDPCATVRCAYPVCPNGAKPIKKNPTDCCLTCPIDPCALVKCLPPQCPKGYKFKRSPDSCCSGTCVKDCTGILCPIVDCMIGYIPYQSDQFCCTRCKQDCRLVKCAMPVCEDGSKPIKKEEECCYHCPPVDCSTVRCARPLCQKGEELYTPPDRCCPICRPIVNVCPIVDCAPGYVPYIKENNCTGCKQDCTLVRCAMPVCEDGSKPIKKDEECCYHCPPVDCSAVQCARPLCQKGEELYTPPDRCCPICRPIVNVCPIVDCAPGYVPYIKENNCTGCKQDCTLVRCAMPVCEDGSKPTKNEEECCYRCPPVDCSAVQCLRPICKDTEELYTPPEKCCPICRPKLTA